MENPSSGLLNNMSLRLCSRSLAYTKDLYQSLEAMFHELCLMDIQNI